MEVNKTPLSVDVDKQLLLKFKSMCVLKETTMSEEVEKLIREWVSRNEGEPAQEPAMPTQAPSAELKPMTPQETTGSNPGEDIPNDKEKAFL